MLTKIKLDFSFVKTDGPRRYHMIWTLKIKLLSGRWVEKDWEATIVLDASSTLADLHPLIQQAVGCDNDHLYGFYM